jgi:hypothetical protein
MTMKKIPSEVVYLSVIYNMSRHVDRDKLGPGINEFLDGLNGSINKEGLEHKIYMENLANDIFELETMRRGYVH